jgi:hypothetical protein
VDVILRGAEVRTVRISLQDVTPAQARRVAARRKREIEAEDPTQGILASTLVLSERGSSAVWVVSSHREVCEALNFDLGLRGLTVDRLVPHALALGAMNRLLPPARSKGLTAIVWLDSQVGSCIIADRLGWVFDRDISLKYAGDRILRREEDTASGHDEDEQNVERLATELQRTFTYVERELNLGDVVRVRLCGTIEGIDELGRALGKTLRMEVRSISERPKSKKETARPTEVGAAVGAAMLPRWAAAANLLPPDAQIARRAIRLRRPLVAAVVVAAFVTLAAGATGFVKYRTVRTEVERVRALAARWDEERDAFKAQIEIGARADRIRRAYGTLNRSEPPWGSMLQVLGAVLPAPLVVQQLEVHRDPSGWKMEVTLEGQAFRQADIAEAVGKLRDALQEHDLFRIIVLEAQGPPQPGPEGSLARYRLMAWVAAVPTEEMPGG